MVKLWASLLGAVAGQVILPVMRRQDRRKLLNRQSHVGETAMGITSGLHRTGVSSELLGRPEIDSASTELGYEGMPQGMEVGIERTVWPFDHVRNASRREVFAEHFRNRELKAEVKRTLEEAGFEVGEHDNPDLQGIASSNICNRCASGSGVQLELPEGLRSRMFQDLTRKGRATRTAIFDQFVTAIRAALTDKSKLKSDLARPTNGIGVKG